MTMGDTERRADTSRYSYYVDDTYYESLLDELRQQGRAVELLYGEVYDEATAAREERRLAWVYDKCYLEDACPEVPRHDGDR